MYDLMLRITLERILVLYNDAHQRERRDHRIQLQTSAGVMTKAGSLTRHGNLTFCAKPVNACHIDTFSQT
jgi:hypothetical protein